MLRGKGVQSSVRLWVFGLGRLGFRVSGLGV